MIPDYINKFRERFYPKSEFLLSIPDLESFLTEVYEQGRKDEREKLEDAMMDEVAWVEMKMFNTYQHCEGCSLCEKHKMYSSQVEPPKEEK